MSNDKLRVSIPDPLCCTRGVNICQGGTSNSVKGDTDATLAVLTTNAGEWGVTLPLATPIRVSTVPFGLKPNLFNISATSGRKEIHNKIDQQDAYELDEKTDGDVDALLRFIQPAGGLTAISTERVEGKFVYGGVAYTFLGCGSVRIRAVTMKATNGSTGCAARCRHLCCGRALPAAE